MKPTFLNQMRPLITGMVLRDTADEARLLIKNSIADGADAVGIQLEKMRNEERTEEKLRWLFSASAGRPIYITNYRQNYNENKNDGTLAQELISYLSYGATLGDVPGSLFDDEAGMFIDNELTTKPDAVKRQMELIDRIHALGKEALISSHTSSFLPLDKVLEIALEHQRRGADISKIVTMANCVEEEMENLRITSVLKKELKIPFLFLAQGTHAKIHRMIGPQLGSVMYLAVREHSVTSVATQPTIKSARAVRDNFDATPDIIFD